MLHYSPILFVVNFRCCIYSGDESVDILITSVVVCIDLSGKEPRRQVGVGIVLTSGSLHGVMVAHWNARDVGLSPALGTIFTIFITPTASSMTTILYKLHGVWLLNLPCVCICTVISCI